MTIHKQVKITSRDKTRFAMVDEEIAPLIKTLWEGPDITTLYSCQGTKKYKDQYCWSNNGKNRAYVMMENTTEAMWFVQTLIQNYPGLGAGRRSNFVIEFDNVVQNGRRTNRIILRFPNAEIDKLTKWIKYWYQL